MTVMSENHNKLANLSINHFLTANNKLWRKSVAESLNLGKFKTGAKNESYMKYLQQRT